jgi:glycosyltransferase involved in cell wall biosynthesis
VANDAIHHQPDAPTPTERCAPLLTIITPVYNRAEFLQTTLDSVATQAFSDYEIIVVDDGSTDDTPVVLARESASDRWQGRLRVFSQTNAGPGAARNVALDHARGEYCMFLDSDDLLFPWSLSLIAEVIASEGRPPIVIGRQVSFTTSQEHLAVVRERTDLQRLPDLFSIGYVGATGTLIVQTKAIKAVGGFIKDRIVGEDAELMIRLGTLPGAVKIQAPGTYGYRLHPGKMSRKTANWTAGALALIKRYDAGAFPGNEERRRQARKIVSHNAAFCACTCALRGDLFEGIKIYLKTFFWQLNGGEYGYLVKTPFRLLLGSAGLWPFKPGARRAFEMI